MAAVGLLACVPDQGTTREAPEARPHAVALWDLTSDDVPVGVSLWPADPKAPAGQVHHVETTVQGGALVATAVGRDPYLRWVLPRPRPVGGLSIDVESAGGGKLQLFWTSLRCPSYRERCSIRHSLKGGTERIDFMLLEGQLRSLRLDFPERRPGHRVTVVRAVLLKEPIATGVWEASGGVRLERSPEFGLRATTESEDPWMATQTPGLHASWVDHVEVVMTTPSTARPQLFWRGEECEHFEEECSMFLTASDGGRAVHTAALSTRESWVGRIDAFRLDPSPQAGQFDLERIVLMRAR